MYQNHDENDLCVDTSYQLGSKDAVCLYEWGGQHTQMIYFYTHMQKREKLEWIPLWQHCNKTLKFSGNTDRNSF